MTKVYFRVHVRFKNVFSRRKKLVIRGGKSAGIGSCQAAQPMIRSNNEVQGAHGVMDAGGRVARQGGEAPPFLAA